MFIEHTPFFLLIDYANKRDLLRAICDWLANKFISTEHSHFEPTNMIACSEMPATSVLSLAPAQQLCNVINNRVPQRGIAICARKSGRARESYMFGLIRVAQHTTQSVYNAQFFLDSN